MEQVHIGLTVLAILMECRVLWRQRHQNHRHAKVYCERHAEDA